MIMELKGWRRFSAKIQRRVIASWLRNVAEKSEEEFKRGMTSGPHTGRVYTRRGRVHQASKGGEYPASDTGTLVASLRNRVTRTQATIGTNTRYAGYLAQGTGKMARRKMSREALLVGAAQSKRSSRGWVKWQRSK